MYFLFLVVSRVLLLYIVLVFTESFCCTGDAEHKPTISSEPDVANMKLDGTEDYLVLACDGIWDVIKPRNVPQLVYTHLTGGGSQESVAKLLIDHAKAEGSSDNMTVIVTFFDTFELIEPPKPAPDTESSDDDYDDDENINDSD